MKTLVVANWKMNPLTSDEAGGLFLAAARAAERVRRVDVVVCPPYVYLAECARKIQKKRILLGAQDVSHEQRGAFTGEVSADMLRGIGVSRVIVGHSERRAMGETDERANCKLRSALRSELSPILCVGEGRRDDGGAYLAVLDAQISKGLSQITPRQAGKVIIAYEPIWAISSALPGVWKGAASAEEIFHAVIFIRKIITRILGKRLGMETPILYGGSVTPDESRGILESGGVQGFLVGKDSLDQKHFTEIIDIANQSRRDK